MPLATALYIATLNEADLVALNVAKTTFGKNFQIKETTGYIKWYRQRLLALPPYEIETSIPKNNANNE
tara:strand:+ start:154 stop:357 length:204 start_codon:yes stop_codon:yes gene_type:complete